MTQDISLKEYDLSFVQGGPLNKLAARAGLPAVSGPSGIRLRIILVICLTYVPLAVLAAMQGNFINDNLRMPFWADFAQISRYCIVVPLLLLAELAIDPWLTHMVRHLGRLVPEDEIPKFINMIKRAEAGRDSLIAEVIFIVIAVARNVLVPSTGVAVESQTWEMHALANGTFEFSLAYYFANYFAKPIFTFLWLRWLWKYVLWSFFICRVSTLSLKLRPTHPDRLGGLGFLASGQSKFAVLAFANSVLLASRIGEGILYYGSSLLDFRAYILLMVINSLVIFTLPLLAFTPQLLECKRRGLFEYGTLANEYTDAFHEKWILGARDPAEPLLGSTDIQSLADLGNSFEIVQNMKSLIISKGMVLAFAGATLAPFAPLVLTVYPIDIFVNKLWSSLF
jgi:hypothetical protein